MALPPKRVYKQDMPPPGGFPAVKYKKVPYQRGPSGVVIVFGAVGVTLAGLWYSLHINDERKCVPCAAVCPVPRVISWAPLQLHELGAVQPAVRACLRAAGEGRRGVSAVATASS